MTAISATIATPPGPFTVVADVDADGRETVLASGWTTDVDELLRLVHPTLRPAAVQPGRPAAADAVGAYLEGDLAAIDRVRVRQLSGPFLTDAWEVLRTVPAGRPDSYAAFATRCGRPRAVRAAAQACARNAVALFVPCHRVRGSDGGLGGFRYGTPVKQWLLDHEAGVARIPA
jgi:methylated-DNA-[protein]-cysteine S-methyltransferase